jgi:phosphatidylserine/phosphatidylglycerophosphate/cardiolipin synthase-like enzyme
MKHLAWIFGAVAIIAGWGFPAAAESPVSPLQSFAWKLQDNNPFGSGDTERGNHVMIVDHGRDALLLRVHLIRSAQFSIDIQTFILSNDECGRYLAYELIQAAKRGVKVRLLADHFMSARDPEWAAFLATVHPNFELRYYRPPVGQINPSKAELALHGLLFFQAANQRMHHKIFAIDGAIALTGGRNIDNHYYNQSLSYNFYDLDALVVGPVVPLMEKAFQAFWDYRRSIPAEQLGDVQGRIRRQEVTPRPNRADFGVEDYFDDIEEQAQDMAVIKARFVDTLIPADRVQFLSDNPGKNSIIGFWGGGTATRGLRKIIRSAKQELLIQSPYLILNRTARRHFGKMRRKNRDMDIIVSTNSLAATDNVLAYSANYKLRTAYIEKIGMEIYEYKPVPAELHAILPNFEILQARAAVEGLDRDPYLCIHAKAFVVDKTVAYIGSYNIDPRSENLNTEVGLLIEDPEVVDRLRRCILGRAHPENAWVIARREFPLSEVNFFFEGLSWWSPVDIWPIRNTTSFELLPGKEPVPPDHPDFYQNYTDVGSFPGAATGSVKQLTTSLYKMFNTLVIPVM